MTPKGKTGATHVRSGAEHIPGFEKLNGIELAAALLLQSHLFGMEQSERQEVMRRIVHSPERPIDRNALINVLNGVKKAAISEMDEWLQTPCASVSLTHHTQKARNELAAKNFALLKNGVSPVFTRFLLNLSK